MSSPEALVVRDAGPAGPHDEGTEAGVSGRRSRRNAAIAAFTLIAATAGLVAADRLCPPDLSRLTASRLILDRHGAMLRAFPTADGQWRLPVDPARLSPNYLRMLVAIEDKRFRLHPGIDPLALARAAWQLVTRGRVVSGGSTLTMQLVRLLEPRPRTPRSKLIEIFRALQIEERLSKDDILRAYVGLVPMGGNLEGARSGSLAWFGKEPAVLSDPEAALLVALPQAPTAARPDRPRSRAKAARDRILLHAARSGVIADASLDSAIAHPIPVARLRFPRLAPHASERMLAADATGKGDIPTTLDGGVQARLEHLLRTTTTTVPSPINLAIIVADWHTGEIFARAGSADYADRARGGMNDMTTAVRSPGSTLKPFVYGMAFDGLLAHPDSVVRDEPTRFDDYAPRNFDGGYSGDVTVRRALQASLNLPAVTVLRRIGPVAFADRFRAAGLPLAFGTAKGPPSLPMVLGGVGITLADLVTAYAALADGGTVKPLFERYPAPHGAIYPDLMRRPAADAVVNILAGMPAPKGSASGLTGIAYKTGTSYRFRDGWAVGFDADHVVGVWMGRADGGTCLPCVGAASAGILFRVFGLMAPHPLLARVLTPVFANKPPPALLRLDHADPLAGGGPHIAFPVAGSRLLMSGANASLTLSADGGHRPYRWVVDGRLVSSLPYAREAIWRPDAEGFSVITVFDAAGRSDETRVRIIEMAAPDGG